MELKATPRGYNYLYKMFKRKKSEFEIITEIHNEFDSAGDRLLEQAKAILNKTLPDKTALEEKAEKLRKLGFINSSPVLEVAALKGERDSHNALLIETKKEAELILYYKQAYPFQKFLTENELERICDKYKLVSAPVASYIKDVPEKNLEEIANAAPLQAKDRFEVYYKVSSITFMSAHTKAYKDYVCNILEDMKFEKDDLSEYNFDTIVEDFKGNKGHPNYFYNSLKMEKIEKDGLFICAPESHFNLNSLTKKGKLSFFQVSYTEIKDPIVYRYCKGGVQVLSKWGLEAEDDFLVNEKLN